MPGPATKLGSLTAHGGTVIGPGCPTVLIEKVPAIRVGPDTHICPMVTPGTPPIPHGGLNNMGPGVATVLIGGFPASTIGDNFLCIGPPAPVVMGATTVFIGTGGAGAGGGGGGGGAGSAATVSALKAGTVQPVKGTETFPIDVQATILDVNEYAAPEMVQNMIQQLAQAFEAAGGAPKEEEKANFTIAQAVECLERLERNDGFETARFFSVQFRFDRLSQLAMDFTKGIDTNPDNDPNIMPTRFMILYGADDAKLQQNDDHPDYIDGEKHKNNVGFLRKSLIGAGYDIAETGAYDDEMYIAHCDYMVKQMQEYLANLGQLDDNAETDDANEELPKGHILLRLRSQDGPFLQSLKCTLSSSPGKVSEGTTDRAGHLKFHDMVLDSYSVSFTYQGKQQKISVPWSATDKNVHFVIVKD